MPLSRQTAAIFDDATVRQNMQQLIQLRWLAVFGQVVTIAVVHSGFGVELPLLPISTVLVLFITFNFACWFRWRVHEEFSNAELFVSLLVDVATLTAELYLCGGASNPFALLYLLQVILSAVLLEAWSAWTIVAITTACMAGLTRFYRPLAWPPEFADRMASPFILGVLICFVLNAALLVFFIKRISRNLHARDSRLADLRQRAAEEEHIVRMGLLATGAAHELGTPLATLSVILGDWRRMPVFATDPDLRQEIEVMELQLARCKGIVSGILLSAGETRGEASIETTLGAFLDELVADWRSTRPSVELVYRQQAEADLRIVSDSAVRQMIGNVLDNAAEASPGGIEFEVARRDDRLVLMVSDDGPGFMPEMLAQLGKPYQSSKGRPGSGLGLFLVVNVARTLGGSVTAVNRPQGGAAVTVSIPLAAIGLDE
ncbi:ATP-binding protein [soil metagenome]